MNYPTKTMPYAVPRGQSFNLKFDSIIEGPENYNYFVDVLLNASEEDVVNIYFASGGGSGDTMVMMMNLISECRAEVHGYLLSQAHSAASYLFLTCPYKHVGKYTSMLCHQVSYGYMGSHHEVKSYVDHIDREEQRLVRDTYKGFLSEEETDQLLNGKQIWLDEDDIVSRLERQQSTQTEAFLDDMEREQLVNIATQMQVKFTSKTSTERLRTMLKEALNEKDDD